MKFFRVSVGFVMAAMIAASASAHRGATGVVEERMHAMMVLSNVLKAMTDIKIGDREFDVSLIREAARVLSYTGGAAMTSRFPPGSNLAPSEARPDIWEDWLEFAILANQLSVIGNAMDLAVENGMSEPLKADAATVMGANSEALGIRTGQALQLDFQQLTELKFDELVDVLGQTCTACHTQFRQKCITQ